MRIGGRGMLLIRTFMDEVVLQPGRQPDHPGQAGPAPGLSPWELRSRS